MENKTEIYQLCPHSGYLMESYLIKTPNNKIIMIDGGSNTYMEKAYLPSAIRAILGLKEGDYFEIDAWFFSHGHNDHYGEFIMMMKEYDKYSNYKVNNFYFDFPDFENSTLTESDYSLKDFLSFKNALNTYAKVNDIEFSGDYYNVLNGKVINQQSVNKGLILEIDNVLFDVLQTWDETDEQVNANSLVIRVSEKNKKTQTCLFLNDASVNSGNRLLNTYGEKLKSDIVQMAHHGQAGVDKNVYDAVNAKIRLWPITFWLWQDHKIWLVDKVRSWFSIEENNYTDGDILACAYSEYPKDYTSISDWKKCVDKMKIIL